MSPLVRDEAALQELEQFEADMQWICDHYEELKARYPDEFVAVLHGRLIAHNSQIEVLLEGLRSRYEEQMGHIAIKFIYSQPPNIIL